MARIVLALGTSHSPLLSTPVEFWKLFAEKDKTDPRVGDFQKLSREKASWIGAELTEEKWRERYEGIQKSLATLAEICAQVAPDAIVTLGDDQREVFTADHMPALNIYWGESVVNEPPDVSRIPEWRRAWLWANHPEKTTVYPCEPELGRHLVESLIAQEFDVTHLRRIPEGRKIGHAFNFIYRRIMNGRIVPQVPVMLNTYYPPNQPTLKRCYALGKALKKAIESWPQEKTVALVASGGLTHFVVDEKLDRGMLDAMQKKDAKRLLGYPEELFVHGTSEIRNWVVVAGAMEEDNKKMEIIDYIPCYRTSAGSGVGAAFAVWR